MSRQWPGNKAHCPQNKVKRTVWKPRTVFATSTWEAPILIRGGKCSVLSCHHIKTLREYLTLSRKKQPSDFSSVNLEFKIWRSGRIGLERCASERRSTADGDRFSENWEFLLTDSRFCCCSLQAFGRSPLTWTTQITFFIVAPCILKLKTSHSPTNALFIKLGLKFTLEFT
jgi:hypothetical protein